MYIKYSLKYYLDIENIIIFIRFIWESGSSELSTNLSKRMPWACMPGALPDLEQFSVYIFMFVDTHVSFVLDCISFT